MPIFLVKTMAKREFIHGIRSLHPLRYSVRREMEYDAKFDNIPLSDTLEVSNLILNVMVNSPYTTAYSFWACLHENRQYVTSKSEKFATI